MSEKITESTPEATPPEETTLVGTSAVLFPEQNKPIKGEVTPPETPAPAPEVKAGEEQLLKLETPPAETPPNPTETEYLSETDFGKKVKVVVDGVEQVVDINEALKGYSTQKALTQRGQKIAEDKKALEELRLKGLDPPAPSEADTEKLLQSDDEYYEEFVKPYVAPLHQKIEDLNKQITDLHQSVKPVAYNATQTEIARKMAEEGLTDYEKVLPQIENKVAGMTPEEQKIYNTKSGFIFLYKEMKVNEGKKAEEIKPLETADSVRNLPDVADIGGDRPNVDSASLKLAEKFDTAQKSGDMHDWSEVILEKYS